ncbi:MAG: hypothetical protein KIT72_17715 [Polyangiaceae bacterium]|nr:hypothetical protein [Polyangiaceae bacterium]MCW5792253.1 hypothetical protein [Polyangiaceae bacterium]
MQRAFTLTLATHLSTRVGAALHLGAAACLSAAVCFSMLGCSSAGPYGHSRVYSPLAAERAALEGAVEYDPVMATRNPEAWQGKPISLFGVVVSRDAGSGGTSQLKLSLRTLEPRNLCEEEAEDSCRVTVSDREHAVVHAHVALSGDDDLGRYSVGGGSLVRLVGELTDDFSEDGTPLFRATYYRHWPRGFYVTTADRGRMRR